MAINHQSHCKPANAQLGGKSYLLCGRNDRLTKSLTLFLDSIYDIGVMTSVS